MSFDNVQALPPGTRLGDYRLDATIGHGGFGITYRAFDTQLAKFVAIKEYLPIEFAVRGGDGQVVARGARYTDDFTWGRDRFLDEARALARFRHPHIVPVLRYLESNGTAYTVMEFEDGKNVRELLHEPEGRLPVDDVRRLADALVGGLAAVHAQGFLHRDIKPSNIIIRRADSVPVLIDFGAARQAMGERSRTLTSVLTPQYAPIEQYALDGKQGPWTDIYSACAVLYHSITGEPPPDAAARVGSDPYRSLASSHVDRFDPLFLNAIDLGLAFSPTDRPQNVDQWAALLGNSLARATDAPTQRMTAAPSLPVAPRLGGASREVEQPAAPSPRPRRRWRRRIVLALVAVLVLAGGTKGIRQELQALFGGLRQDAPQPASASTQVATPVPIPSTPTPTPTAPTTTPTPTPLAPTPASPTARPPGSTPLSDQAERSALAARTVLEKADEAARTARSMAGEARIVAARAAQPDLQNSDRTTLEGGANYIGQLSDGKRQGLGVTTLTSGERQAGDWASDRLNGLGTVRFADDTRYAGQWRDGEATGLGMREKPGVERAEGNFIAGRLEGLGVKRTLTGSPVVQSGEFRGDQLEGPGVETMGNQRYEGGFHAGQRNGYGRLIAADGKVQSGRWDAGKPVELSP